MIVGIPRNDFPHPRETSSLLPARDKTSFQRSYLGSGQLSRTLAKLANNTSQQLVKLERMNRAGFSLNITPFYPFKIYQPNNFSSFATGITFLGQDGTPTVCKIDATQPTNFGSNPPTVNPTTDAWRFWSVRCGQVECRPIYTNIGLYQVTNSQDNAIIGTPNNWGYKYNVFRGTDGVSPYYTSPGLGDSKVYGFDDPTSESFNAPLIIAGNPDGTGDIVFSIWINIAPDTSGALLPLITIQAATGPYPDSNPQIIPVGVVAASPLTNTTFGPPYVVIQELFDHVGNLFPPGDGNFEFGASSVMNFRGQMDGDLSFAVPDDLLSQVFYPGDVVEVEYSSGTFNLTSICQYADAAPGFLNDNPIGDPNWSTLFTFNTI